MPKLPLPLRNLALAAISAAVVATFGALLLLTPPPETYSQGQDEATPTPRTRQPSGPTPTPVSPEKEQEIQDLIDEWDKLLDSPGVEGQQHSDCDVDDIPPNQYSVSYVLVSDNTVVIPRAVHRITASSVVSADFQLWRNGVVVKTQNIPDTDAF